ncbi:MAG: ribulose-phosphate 3-epimerase [Clostridiales bacterium]|nr:ribulose-phosphate 3-epimerase [Clostridiales bacterium]
MSIKIAPSLLAADFANLESEVKKVADGGAEYLHLDVMDGAFVPNISFGPAVIKALRPKTDMVFDVHLMINDPIRYVDAFADAGADIINFHYESCSDQMDVIEKIHSLGKKAGITIKPETPEFVLDTFIPCVDLILVMSVNPGFGGQKFIPESAEKLEYLRAAIDASGRKIDLEIDGGINADTAKIAAAAGADVLVAGTAVFRAENVKEAILSLKNA